LDPLNLHASVRLGDIFMFQHDYDNAIAQYRKILEIDPTFVEAMYDLAYGYQMKGQYEQAIEELAQGLTAEGYAKIAAETKRVYATSGWKGVLRKRIERASNPENKDFYDPTTWQLLTRNWGRTKRLYFGSREPTPNISQ